MIVDMCGVGLKVGDEVEGFDIYEGLKAVIGEISGDGETICLFHNDACYTGGMLNLPPRALGRQYSWLITPYDLKTKFKKGDDMRIAAYTELADGTYIKPITDADGVVLVACDKRGTALDRGILARITSRGLMLTEGVSPEIGIPLDAKGRLLIAK